MSNPADVFAGIDVSKDHLDLALSQTKKSWQSANSPQGFDALAETSRGARSRTHRPGSHRRL